jgi:hypothetical protein
VVEYIININMVDLFKKNLENDGSDFEDISISSLMDEKRQAPQVAGQQPAMLKSRQES